MHDEAFWVNFYQLRLLESIVQDMLELCPNAWHLQVANPVLAGITYLSRKYPQAKMVRLCHGFGGVYHVAHLLGLSREGLTFEVPGVNHFVWLTKAYHNGQDVFPLLHDWLATQAEQHWQGVTQGGDMSPVALDLYKRFGAVPIGDTCTNGGGSWPWWYHSDDATEQRWHENPAAWWSSYFEWGTRKVAEINQIAADATVRVTEHFAPKPSGEVMVPLIEAIACDTPRVIIGNVPNRGGYVPGVPTDVAVEIPLLASKRGLQGIETSRLPEPVLAHLLADRVGPVNTELEAFAGGSRALLHQLVLMDPFTRSEHHSTTLIDQILALPYHQEMREHFA